MDNLHDDSAHLTDSLIKSPGQDPFSQAEDMSSVFYVIGNQDWRALYNQLQKLDQEIDITDQYDPSGFSPLHLAAFKNNIEMVELLVNFVKDKQQKTSESFDLLKFWVNSPTKTDEEFRAIHFAAYHGNLRMITFLTEQGADIKIENSMGVNVLHVGA